MTHDLATAKYFCDPIAIMYLGRVVEIGPAADLRSSPTPLHQGTARGDPRARPATSGAAQPAARRDPRRRRAAAGVFLPPSLPRGRGGLWLGVARSPRAGRGALDRRPGGAVRAGTRVDRRSHVAASVSRHHARARRHAWHRGRVARPGQGRRSHRAVLAWRRGDRLGGGAAQVTFREPVEPLLLDIGDVRVACHLHDPRFAEQAPPA